jgi:hypothetical protein
LKKLGVPENCIESQEHHHGDPERTRGGDQKGEQIKQTIHL